MFLVKLLTFMLVSATSLKYVYSINREGCGVRTRRHSTPLGQSMGSAQQLALEDNLDDKMMYDDTGMGSRVVGGVTSTVQWPWMVGIFDEGLHACGGSMIDDIHVLTAAHCFDENTNPRDYIARIGEMSQGDSGKSHKIAWIKIHEDYIGGPIFFNDIALLRLRHPVPEGSVPICLPNSEALQEGETLTITGFGAVKEGGKASHTLQEVHSLPVIATSTCDQIIKSLSPTLKGVTSAQICTGDEKGGKSSCQGDSGGPVTLEESGRWWLLGLVSYSAGCARPGIPTVHTRISSYRGWIDRSIEEGKKKENKMQRKGIRRVIEEMFG